jgi:hypothetical protein
MLSRRVFLTLSVAIPSLPAFAAPDPDPSAIVKSIYGKRDLYGAQAALQLRGPRGRILSRSLAKLWKRSDDETPSEDEPVPGFDIASNSQDREIARVEVTVERQNIGRKDAARATVAAKLFNKGPRIEYPASDDIVHYDFVRENGHWAIDNVRSTIDGKERTIRGLLTEGMKK